MKRITYFIFVLFVFLSVINVYADTCENQTIAYFNSKITKSYGNGDMILLENIDSSCNKRYGLIDAGRKINTTASTEALDFLNYFS